MAIAFAVDPISRLCVAIPAHETTAAKRERRHKHDLTRPFRDRHRHEDDKKKSRIDVLKILGDRCACCGSREKLEVDHIKPCRGSKKRGLVVALRAVRKDPTAFQLLCACCNNWKSDGPFCPCKYWDTLSSSWRL